MTLSVLPAFALPRTDELLSALQSIVQGAPFRHMVTPGGFKMSMASTNCGDWGWITDRRGYRYARHDPSTMKPWPHMPRLLSQLAALAAAASGFSGFEPDACLINRYLPKSRLSLHQDKDERDFAAPIVTLSLGMPATFLFGTQERGGTTTRIPLTHGDAVVFGGVARLNYHGVLPLKDIPHPLLGSQRISLTFRKSQ